MKKILVGFFGIFLVLGIVAGTGYALFTDTVTMEGMVLGTATPGLMIKTDEDGLRTYRETLDFQGMGPFQLLLPGKMDYGEFWLWNNSESGPDLDFSLTGELTSATGDWNELKDVAKMRFCIYYPDTYTCNTNLTTPWYSLAQWNGAARDLPGQLDQGAEQRYGIQLMMKEELDNSYSDKLIEDVSFEITGTQIAK